MRLTEFTRQILAASLADHAMKPMQPKCKRPSREAVVDAALAVYLSESKRILAAASRAGVPDYALKRCTRFGGSLDLCTDDGCVVQIGIENDRIDGKPALSTVVVDPRQIRGKNGATLTAVVAWEQHTQATDTARREIRRQLGKISTLAQARRHWQDAADTIDQAVERMNGPAPNAVPLSAVASAAVEKTKGRKVYR